MGHPFETDSPHADEMLSPEEIGPPPRDLGRALEQAVGLSGEVLARLYKALQDHLVQQLTRGAPVVVHGFGGWTSTPWRSPRPSATHRVWPWDPVEVPIGGPVAFEPAPALVRQLSEGQLNPRAAFSNEELQGALRATPGLPPPVASQALRILLVVITDLLLVERHCTVPGVGTLRVVKKPTRVLVQPETLDFSPVRPPTVQFSPSPELLARLPSTFRLLPQPAEVTSSSQVASFLNLDPEAEKGEEDPVVAPVHLMIPAERRSFTYDSEELVLPGVRKVPPAERADDQDDEGTP